MELVPIKMGTPLYLVEADSICQFTLSEVFIADEPQETLTAIIKKLHLNRTKILITNGCLMFTLIAKPMR